MESHSQIEDEVAEWLARRDGGQWSDDDEAALQLWISDSIARRVAYLRLKSTWDTAGRLRVLRAGSSPASSGDGVPPPGEWRSSPFFTYSTSRNETLAGSDTGMTSGAAAPSRNRGQDTVGPAPTRGRRRWRLAALATAATVVFAIAAGLSAYLTWGGSGDRYATPIGGLSLVPMSDGSNVTLNTDSVIRVAMTEGERRVQLEHGEAFFDVAKDPTRPFVVRAGNRRITAVGTKFSVQHLGRDVRVLVTEGKVRVDDETSSPILVAAGNMARAAGSAVVVEKAAPPRVEEILSWRDGYLRFSDTPLADAVAEINRYNTRKIFVDDPRLAAVRISGTFRPTQYEAFVRVLHDGFSVHAEKEGDRITLSQEQ
ncbi:MAG: FecR domain-containing protein [Gammaproteobacteria bacterium]